MAITKEEVAEAVRAWCTAWHTRDIETLLAMEATAFGFGFRPFTPRDHVAEGQAGQRERLGRFFGRMDSYRLVPEDFETSPAGVPSGGLAPCRLSPPAAHARRAPAPSRWYMAR
jgi:hypothetical protein